MLVAPYYVGGVNLQQRLPTNAAAAVLALDVSEGNIKGSRCNSTQMRAEGPAHLSPAAWRIVSRRFNEVVSKHERPGSHWQRIGVGDWEITMSCSATLPKHYEQLSCCLKYHSFFFAGAMQQDEIKERHFPKLI